MRIVKPFLALVCLTAFLCSCQTSDETSFPQLPITNDQEQIAFELGKSLQVGMQNPEVRHFLKDQILQQFDGDYNVLAVKALKEQSEILGGENLLSIIWREHPIGDFTSQEEFLAAVQAKYPLMQIAMPEIEAGTPEAWDTEHHLPAVAIAPAEGFSETLNAITADGTFTTLSGDIEPIQLTLVISGNERTKLARIEPTPANAYYEINGLVYVPKFENGAFEDGLQNITDVQGRQENGPRDYDNGKDELVRFRFVTEDDYKAARDGWFDGKIEMRCLILFARSNGNISNLNLVFEDIRERDVKNLQWYYFYHTLFTWDDAIYGNAMKYIWWEVDGGNTVDVQTTVNSEFDDGTTVSNQYTYQVENKDDDMGQAIVEYCDPISGYGTTYNTTDVYFSVR